MDENLKSVGRNVIKSIQQKTKEEESNLVKQVPEILNKSLGTNLDKDDKVGKEIKEDKVVKEMTDEIKDNKVGKEIKNSFKNSSCFFNISALLSSFVSPCFSSAVTEGISTLCSLIYFITKWKN